MLRELIDEEGTLSPDKDPLFDPPEETLIGKGYYSLKPLGCCLIILFIFLLFRPLEEMLGF